MPYLNRVATQVMLASRHKVSGWLEGVHASRSAGRSLDFHDVREYVRGDDVSDIDWKASARHGSLLVKRHVAEHRATLMIAVTTGESFTGQAAPGEAKIDVAIDAAATLGMLANQHGDYVGLAWWDGAVRTARPSTRRVNVERMLAHAHDAAVTDDPNIAQLVERAARVLRRPGIVAVICGDIDLDPHFEALLRRLVAQHEVVLVTVDDLDPTLPADQPVAGFRGRRPVPDALRLDTLVREQYFAAKQARATRRSRILARLAISHTTVDRSADVVPAVIAMVRSVHA